MRIAIDNLDGKGAVDYTSAVMADGPITVQRALNVPSRCTVVIVLGVEGLAVPVRRGRVIVTADDGTVLFTGYLATEPVQEYVGGSSSGAVYCARLSGVSDEWLLDKTGTGASETNGPLLSLTGSSLIALLAARAQGGSGSIAVTSAGETAATGIFSARDGAAWSVNAGDAAGAAYAGYRALNGSVQVQPAGGTVHALSDADGTLSVSELTTANVRELANDVLLTGAEEPAVYVTECFIGDGTTTEFELSDAAYRDTVRTMVTDDFGEATIDPMLWTVSDPGSHLSLTSAGLTMNGGTGADGVTTVTALDAIEMGGALVTEMGAVTFSNGSAGMIAGFYEGPTQLANCFAGFQVSQVNGVTTLTPVVNGATIGTPFTPAAGHSYTLRVRLHCVEMQRVMQRYYSMVDGAVEGFGSLSGVSAPMDVVFEVLDEGDASNTPVTVLYDSFAAGVPLATTPATCAFVVANSIGLVGAIGAVSVTRPGSLWVRSVPPSGAQLTRLVGTSGQGVDCEASYGTSAGVTAKVTFFAGRVPVANELILVSYRTHERAVARIADAASIAAEAATGFPGTARWIGKVLQPVARSSADCESAALAVLAFATSRAAAVAGTYKMVNPASDIWPGDVLAITSAGVTSSLLVRSVTVADGASVPEVLSYKIAFANDWATEWDDGLGMKLSEEIAADAWLPQTASNGSPQVLANLQQMSVTSLTTTAIGIDAGLVPPSGGGFEVRRKDWSFGVGVDDADLVLRSPVRAFSIPRAEQVERYYMRMYDASTPPVYSRWSSAVFVNAPVS